MASSFVFLLALYSAKTSAFRGPASLGSSRSQVRRDNGNDGVSVSNSVYAMLDKVPVFSLVDSEGNAAVVRSTEGNGEGSLDFFLDARMALRRREELKNDTFRIAGTSLGQAYLVYGTNSPTTARFFADGNELTAARQVILRGYEPDFNANNITAQELLTEYLKYDTRFAEPTDIPLFTISQLQLLKSENNSVTPHYFSLSDLVQQWKIACDGDEAAFASGQISVHSLADIVLMSSTSSSDDCTKENEALHSTLGSPDSPFLFIPTKAALSAIGVNL